MKRLTLKAKNASWQSIPPVLNRIFNWFLSYIEWFLFLFLILFKLYLFARYTNTVFYGSGAFGFLKDIFLFLFKGQSFNYLRHDLVMISLGFLLLSSFWTLLLKRRKRIITLLVLNALLSFLFFSDIVHERYFGGYISVAEVLQANQLGDVGGSIAELVAWKDILFFIDLIVLIPLSIWLLKKRKTGPAKRKVAGALVSLFFGWFFISQAMFAFYYDYGGKGILDKMISDETVYNQIGILGYHYFDGRRYFKDFMIRQQGVSAERTDEIQQWFNNKESVIDEASFGTMEGKNLIVVQVEALQDFVIDRSVNGEEITPFLNDLKEESLYFNNFYHQAGEGRTSDADLLVNASLHPLSSGSVFTRFPTNAYDTIPYVLEEKGYASSVHHAFKASFWNRNLVYDNWGYNTFYSQEDYNDGETIGWGLGDVEFLQQSVDQMPDKQPFYSFLITLTSHHPYPMPEKYHTLHVEGLEDKELKNYLQSIHYVDNAIKQFVDKLKAEGLWEESVVVFYGDHDAKILKEGKESGLFVMEGRENKVDFLIEKDQVPLLIHTPGGELTGVNSTFGGQIDIAPTLFHLLGVETEDKYLIGEGLLNDQDQHPVVFHDLSVTDGEVWYVPSEETAFESGTCYDLQMKQQTDVNACRDVYNQGAKEKEISRDIILTNWLKGKR